MFTGIVEEIGKVPGFVDGKLTITASKVTEGMEVGGSISVNGTCLTAIDCFNDSFSVNVVPETLRRTNLGELAKNDRVNLESPIPVTGRLDGHIVQGHIDGTGTITSIKREGDAFMIRVKVSSSLMRFLVEKGFIALDGASLTIVHCDNQHFDVTLIPHTAAKTILGQREVGDRVKVEIDIMAKYVKWLLISYSK